MKLKNKYFILRHGEAVSNARQVLSSWPEKFKNPLTKHGKEMIIAATEILKENHAQHGRAIDIVFSSDLLRTKETAKIVQKELKIPLKFDTRLREIGFGIFNGKTREAAREAFGDRESRAHQKRKFKSETYKEVLLRVKSFLKEIDSQQKGKNVLIVSHQLPLWIMENFVKGIPLKDDIKRPEEKRIAMGEIRELN